VELSAADREALLRAKLVLEYPGLAARAAELLGHPIERGIESLPRSVQHVLAVATRSALKIGLNVAMSTLNTAPKRSGDTASVYWHRVAGGVTGAAGGFFGIAAMPAELPLSTIIILRSIADIARSEGENLHDVEARLACLEVLALGGGRPDAYKAAETGYYAARIGMAQSLHKAVEHLAHHGFSRRLAPPVAEWLTRIAARFSVQVSQEAMLKMIPLVSAASGAAINTLFVQHFQDVARAHFTIRRLERAYGVESVQQMYVDLKWVQWGADQQLPEA
jgi:cation transport regulator ChaB